jgi:hypothetical protein
VKRRGNPNWGKTTEVAAIVVEPSAFEQQVKKLGLIPDQYLESTRLKEWARHNMNSKYIPEDLLKGWGLTAGANSD